jgi:hypothetical protein
MNQELENLKKYLLAKGVEPFWVNSALSWIRQAMAGNTHWATGLQRPQVKVNTIYKCVDRLTVHCTINSVSGSVPGIITYTFGNGHKVNIKAKPQIERKVTMKTENIKIGSVYDIKVGRNTTPVRITKPAEGGGWEAIGLTTNKPVAIKSADRIVGPHNPKKSPKGSKSAKEPAKAATQDKKTDTAKRGATSPKIKRASALDSAVRVLAEAKKPLTCQELIETMAAKDYWKSASGKTPRNTLYAAILKEISTKGKESRFKKVDRGQFALAK